MLVFSRLLMLLGVLVMLGMAFKIGPLDANSMIFTGAALILVGVMLPKVFTPSSPEKEPGGESAAPLAEEEE